MIDLEGRIVVLRMDRRINEEGRKDLIRCIVRDCDGREHQVITRFVDQGNPMEANEFAENLYSRLAKLGGRNIKIKVKKYEKGDEDVISIEPGEIIYESVYYEFLETSKR